MALAENQIADSEFGFSTRNTNQLIYTQHHILTVAKLRKKKLSAAFLDLTAAYDSLQREKLWAHLQNIHVPKYLLSAVRALYKKRCIFSLTETRCRMKSWQLKD